MPLDRISTQDIRQYMLQHQSRGLSGYSIHDIYKVLRAIFRWALREEVIQRDPTAPITPPKLPQLLPKVLAHEQVEALLQHLKKNTSLLGRRNQLIVMAFLDCGLRSNELANLCLEDVHVDSSLITVRQGKGNKQRVVPIGPTLHRYLWRYLAEWRAKFHPKSNFLFVGREGKPLQAVAVHHMVTGLLINCLTLQMAN